MIRILAFSLCALSVFAQVVPSTANSAFFSIDPQQRGLDIVSLFNTLNTSATYNSTYSQVGIKTFLLPSGNVLFFQNVLGIKPATNSTILAINTLPQGSRSQNTTVVFVEQISEMIYSPTPLVSSSFGSFISASPTGILPYFPIDIAQRGADIYDIVTLLKAAGGTNNTVNIGTTLSGSYYAPLSSSGTILNVQSVKIVSPTLLLIQYYNTVSLAYIVVSPDQVTGIYYAGNPL